MVLGIILNKNLICYSRSQVDYPSNLVPPVVSCLLLSRLLNCLFIKTEKVLITYLIVFIFVIFIMILYNCKIKIKIPSQSLCSSYNSVAVAKMFWILVSLCLCLFFFFLASLVFHKSILCVCFQVKNQAHISCSDFLIFSNYK